VSVAAAPATASRARVSARSVPFAAPLATLVLAVALRVVLGAPAPGYDAWWSLAWGRELAHGALPDLTATWAPTPHPLAILAAAPLSLLGGGAPTAAGLLSLVALAGVGVTAAVLGGRLFGPVAGVVTSAILVTRPLIVGAALEGSADVPFLALLLGAGAALVARRDRRALALLLAAGLLRPEAWALALVLAVLTRRPRAVALALAAPLAWALFDLLCTGDPLHSLHGTRDLADGLGRPRSLPTALRVAPDYLTVVLGDALAPAGAVAALAAVWLAPRRTALPLVVLSVGLAGFLVLGAAGLPLLYRYTLLPAAALALLVGWGTQAPLAHRRAWPAAAVLGAVVLAAVGGARHDLRRHVAHAQAAGAEQRDLSALVHAVAPAIARCGARAARQRAAPQLAYFSGRAPAAAAGAVLLVPRPGSLAERDHLAPTDGAAPPPAAHLLRVHGAWTASAAC
jgi:hypothetical protein